MVDEDHAAADGGDQVRAADQADRPVLCVDDHSGAVVALPDLLRDVGDEILALGDQGILLHQAPARGGQGDHPRGDVGVQR